MSFKIKPYAKLRKKQGISTKNTLFFLIYLLYFYRSIRGTRNKHTPKKEDKHVITKNKIPFLFYQRRYDGTVAISDCCMQYWNGFSNVIKDVFGAFSTRKGFSQKEICLDVNLDLCDRIY